MIPDDERPQVVNPPNGFVATANYDPVGVMADNDPFNSGRLSSPGSIYYLSGYFTFALRAARITRLLRAKIDAAEPISVDDMKAFQGNTQMLDAELLLPFLLTAHANALAGGAPAELAALGADADVAEAAARFAAWDFSAPTGISEGWDAADTGGARGAVSPEEAAHSVAATLYNVWRGTLLQNTSGALAARIDPGLRPFIGFGALRGVFALLSQSPFTGVGVSGIDFFPEPAGLSAEERRDVVLLQSLRDALDSLASSAFAAAFASSTSQDDYRWGLLNRLTLPHLLGGAHSVPPAGGFADLGSSLPGIARDGAPETVNTTFGPALGENAQAFQITGGSSWRRVMSPGHSAAPPGSVLGFSSMPGGASGDADDPLYASRLPVWLTVDHEDVPVEEADVSGFPSEPVVAAEVTKAQRSCITALNGRLAAVGRAQDKAAARCLGNAAKGNEPDARACLTADAKGKVTSAREKALAIEAKKCGDPSTPVFAYAGAEVASDGGAAESLGLVGDLFGADLSLAVLPRANEKAGAACQREVLKGAQKAMETIWKQAGKAKKGALAGKRGAEPARSGAQVHDAVAAVFEDAKVAKALAGLDKKGGKKCADVTDLAAAFPGRCAGAADAAALTSCAGERARCRACRAQNAFDALPLACDVLDDGAANESC